MTAQTKFVACSATAQAGRPTPGAQQRESGYKASGQHKANAAVAAADRIHAKELAQLESCSLRTAQRLMASGRLGPVRGRSRADRWISRPAYQAYLATL